MGKTVYHEAQKHKYRVTLELDVLGDFDPHNINWEKLFDLNPTETVNAFPYPASDNIQFVWKEAIQHIEIFDMTGKRVASLNPNQIQVQINTSAWSTGLYVAHVMSTGKMECVLFEVNR